MTTRRHILKGLGGLAIAPFFLRSMSAQAAGSDGILVSIQLAGGNDGLNTVVPLGQYRTYQALRRPTAPPSPEAALDIPLANLAATAFDANPSVPASAAHAYAFNPVMGAMRQLYATGHLAVVAGVGLPLDEAASLDHEVGQYDWQTGTINSITAGRPGWLATTLDGIGATGPLGSMISVSGDLPLLLSDRATQALVLPTPIDNFGISTGGGDDQDQLLQTYQQILALPPTNPVEAYSRAVATGAGALANGVQDIASAVSGSDYPAPQSDLDQQLQQIARLIIGGAGARAYFAAQDGYDTHSAQNPTQVGLLGDLSTALHNFYTYLRAHGASSKVVVATFSDFGRRPYANLDFGTDHGAASVCFVLGDRVHGGVYGRYPDLTKLDENGNLAMQVDFRNVISDLITFMGGNPTAVLGATLPRLGFV